MSLEQALSANTEALNALRAQLAGGTPLSAKLEKAEAVIASTSKPAPAAKPAKPAAPKAEPAPGLDYETVKTKALALVDKKGREALVAVNAQFKVKVASELKPEQYADYIKAVEAAGGDQPEAPAETESLV